MSNTQFGSIADAKEYCETMDIECKGIIQLNASNGSTSSGSGKSYYAATTICGPTKTRYTSWVKTNGDVQKVLHGDYTGEQFSEQPIPRAFADDYTHSSSPDRITNLTSTADTIDMYQTTTSIWAQVL